MRIYGLLPLVLPELELRCGAGSPNHDCAWQELPWYCGKYELSCTCWYLPLGAYRSKL